MKRQTGASEMIRVKFKVKPNPPETKSEYTTLIENERKFRKGKRKDLSAFIRGRSLVVECKCGE